MDLARVLPPAVVAFATSAHRPCSSLVAAWVLAVSGRAPAAPNEINRWIDLDRELWARLNLARDGIWSFDNLVAAREVLGGTIAKYVPGETPTLTPGRWHVVQRWRDTQDGPRGHAYLVRYDGGDRVLVVDSTTDRGVRAMMAPVTGWWSRAATEGVLTLPAGVGEIAADRGAIGSVSGALWWALLVVGLAWLLKEGHHGA